jgi:hypothetical protein
MALKPEVITQTGITQTGIAQMGYPSPALASRTAAINRKTPSGTLRDSTTTVGAKPNWASPELSSKIEPIAAIKATQDAPR